MIGFKYQCRYVVLANIKFIQSLQQEPIVLERSVKLNQDHDRGDKGDRGLTVVMGVPKEGEGKFLRTGLRTGGRALKVVQEVLSDLRRKGKMK